MTGDRQGSGSQMLYGGHSLPKTAAPSSLPPTSQKEEGVTPAFDIDTPEIFAFTHDLLGDPFWAVFGKGLQAAAQQFSCRVQHFRTETYSPAAMRELLREHIKERPDAILTTISDAAAVEEPLRAAIEDGIPVIAVNARDPRPLPERFPYLLFVGSDDQQAGRLAGERVVRDGNCRVALCIDHYAAAQTCHSARYLGLAEAMDRAHAACERLGIPGADVPEAAVLIRSCLRSRKDIDAVVTLGPPGARALLLALTEDTDWRGLRHVTFDFSAEQIAGLQDGRVLAVVNSQQYLQAYLGVAMLTLYIRDGVIPLSDVITGPLLIERHSAGEIADSFARGVR